MTAQNLADVLRDMEYPGRGIVLGRSVDVKDVAVYFVTSRSPENQMRVLRHRNGAVWSEPTEEGMRNLKPQDVNSSLIFYPAFFEKDGFIGVSNGAQTRLVYNQFVRSNGLQPLPALTSSLNEPNFVPDPKYGQVDITTYEPDSPNNTPRISGAVLKNDLAFAIARLNASNGRPEFFSYGHVVGKGHLLTTYTGENKASGVPLPSFKGSPIEVNLNGFGSAQDIVNVVYDALGPKTGGKDFRVGVLGVYSFAGKTDMVIKNREAKVGE